jgi:hypothetical protein
MGKITRIISAKLNDDSDQIICTCELYNNYNVQAPLYMPPGDDSFPMKDDRTLLVEIDGSGKYIACGLWSPNTKTAETGEKFLFSRDANGDLISKIHQKLNGDILIDAKNGKVTIELLNDGKININADGAIDINSDGKITLDGTGIELNGSSKKLVTYTELNTAITNFLNALSSHVHTCAAPGSPSSTPTSAITFNISAAETTTLKTGG